MIIIDKKELVFPTGDESRVRYMATNSAGQDWGKEGKRDCGAAS
jgi:hypothetical protein